MPTSPPVKPGDIIAEKYQIEGLLGEGGMGIVVAARHLGLDQPVAIKLLQRNVLHSDDSMVQRFQREARSLARIHGRHVCRVLDTGALDDGTPYLVMERLEGRDLAQELAQRGPLPVGEAVDYVRQACAALEEAHAAGIVHRDLKPANLFLARDPAGGWLVKVLDFGVSKALTGSGAEHLTLTKTASLVGSPIYMSPEQLHSAKDVDGRTDVWALGTILFELITHRTPFYGETIPQLVNAVLHTEPPALDVAVPDGLEAVIRRALCKERDGRFPSAAALSEALRPFASSAQAGHTRRQAVTAAAPGWAAHSLDRETPSTPASTPPPGNALRSQAPPRASGVRWALVGAFIVAATGLAAWLTHRSSSASPDGVEVQHGTTTPAASLPSARAMGADSPAAMKAKPQSEPPAGRTQRARPAQPSSETLGSGGPPSQRTQPVAGSTSGQHPARPAAGRPNADDARPAAGRPNADDARPTAGRPNADDARPAADHPNADDLRSAAKPGPRAAAGEHAAQRGTAAPSPQTAPASQPPQPAPATRGRAPSPAEPGAPASDPLPNFGGRR